uniref:Uncharacterized protein n=1 Tax=Rhizophora mucronata TaxID=61149 RepID=A0A2P2MXG1_RHIMU
MILKVKIVHFTFLKNVYHEDLYWLIGIVLILLLFLFYDKKVKDLWAFSMMPSLQFVYPVSFILHLSFLY